MRHTLSSEGKIIKKIYQGKSEEGRISQVRPKLRLQDGVLNELRILEAEERMAIDRTTWKMLMSN